MSRYKNIVLNLVNDYSINEAKIDKGLTPLQKKLARANRSGHPPFKTTGMKRRVSHILNRYQTKKDKRDLEDYRETSGNTPKGRYEIGRNRFTGQKGITSSEIKRLKQLRADRDKRLKDLEEAKIDKGLTPLQKKLARAKRFKTDPERVIISTEGKPKRKAAHKMLRGSTKAAERETSTSLTSLNRPGKYSNTKILPAEKKYIEVMKRARSRRLKDEMPDEKDMRPPYK